MIEDLVKNLKSENAELQMHCASAIFKVYFVLPQMLSQNSYVECKEMIIPISCFVTSDETC